MPGADPRRPSRLRLPLCALLLGALVATPAAAQRAEDAPASVWPPIAELEDASTLDLEVVRRWREWVGLARIDLAEVRFTSWEVVGGERRPVRIEAYHAIPSRLAGGDPDPGVVWAHGLGGRATAGTARGLAKQLGMAVLCYSGPGQGRSSGRGSKSLFQTVPDSRGSWFWGHAVAGARAVTALVALGEADPRRLGMTGGSAGGMATLVVNGLDPRIKACVPVSGTGALGVAAEKGGWENALLEADGLDRSSEAWRRFVRDLDPIHLAPAQHGAVLLVNGAQDEFFPLTSTARTFGALPGDRHRLCIIADWDHGWYAIPLLSARVDAYDNREEGRRRSDAAVAAWLDLHLRRGGAPLPPMPRWDAGEGLLALEPSPYRVDGGTLLASRDGAYTFARAPLEPSDGGLRGSLPHAKAEEGRGLVVFAEVEVTLGGRRLWLTSAPHLDRLVERIRPPIR